MGKGRELNKKVIKLKILEWLNGKQLTNDELLGILQIFTNNICHDYLNALHINVMFKQIPGNIAVFNNEDRCIYLNLKYMKNKVLLLEALLHELEHYYQLLYVSNYDTPKALRWRNELNNYIGIENPIHNMLQEIEIDAEAFAEVVLSCEFGIEYRNPDSNLQMVIEEYINSGNLLDE